MELESLRKIDADRMTLVGFYVDDTVRGVENAGLSEFESEALRLVAAYERENGRTPGAGEGAEGYTRAASRLLDNAFNADDGPYEMATLMAADLALQRHAADVMKAAEAYGRDGTEPQGFEPFLVEYVIKQDLQDDAELKADWKAISEGRYDDASSYVEMIIDTGVREHEHLPKEASGWMYDNQAKEEVPEFGRRSNLVDVLGLAEDFEQTPAPASMMTSGEVLEMRMAEQRAASLQPSNMVEEIERDGREGVSYADKAIYAGGDRLRIMIDAGDARAGELAAALAHAVMSDRGASASEASAWMFEEKPALGVSDMLARIDREDGDQRFGLSAGTSERIAMSQAKDTVRGLTSSDRSVDGMVAACELAAEERNVPVKRLMAMVAEERRRSDRTFAAHSDVVNDAVKEVLAETSIAQALERRAREKDAPAPEKPFFSMPTIARMDEASEAVANVSDAIRHSDPTILVDKGLMIAVTTLDAAGIDMDRGEGIDRLEAAWGRIIEARETMGVMTPQQEARMVIYDVATQAEAAGIASGFERHQQEASTGWALVTSMNVKTLREEQAGPLALNRSELAEVAAGNLAGLPRGTQAGFALGMSYAKDADHVPLREPQIEKARGGLFSQAAGAAASDFVRVDAKSVQAGPQTLPAFSKGSGQGR